MEYTENLSRLIAKFCIRFDIEDVRKTTVYGWNHARPGIGFFNKNGEEIANICDRSLYDLDDFTNAYNEDGEQIFDEDDDDFKNAKDVTEYHIPVFHASHKVEHAVGLYFRSRPGETILEENHAKPINDELSEMDVYFDVFYKKNHRIIEDAYEFFYKECNKFFRPIIKKAMKIVEEYRRLEELVEVKRHLREYVDLTWADFKYDYDLPKTLTKAKFEARTNAAQKRMEDLLTVTDDCQ